MASIFEYDQTAHEWALDENGYDDSFGGDFDIL